MAKQQIKKKAQDKKGEVVEIIFFSPLKPPGLIR